MCAFAFGAWTGGLRGAVIYRKLSLGSQSEQGERTIERLLSASLTCRLQKRSLFAYLTDVLHANIRGDPMYHRAFANNLLNRWPALWTFTHTDGVEPTNNHAERVRRRSSSRSRRC